MVKPWLYSSELTTASRTTRSIRSGNIAAVVAPSAEPYDIPETKDCQERQYDRWVPEESKQISPQNRSRPSSSSASTTCIKSLATKAVPTSSPMSFLAFPQTLVKAPVLAQASPSATSDASDKRYSRRYFHPASSLSSGVSKQSNGIVWPVPLIATNIGQHIRRRVAGSGRRGTLD